MPSEPERKIEKSLREYARKRRDDAGSPLEIHPATRHLLQGEVSHRFGRGQKLAPKLRLRISQLWPRYALGLVIFASLAVALSIFIPPRTKEIALTRNDRQLAAPPLEEL